MLASPQLALRASSSRCCDGPFVRVGEHEVFLFRQLFELVPLGSTRGDPDSVSRSCGQLDRPFPGGGSYDDSGVVARGEAAALFEILGGQPAQMLIID